MNDPALWRLLLLVALSLGMPVAAYAEADPPRGDATRGKAAILKTG